MMSLCIYAFHRLLQNVLTLIIHRISYQLSYVFPADRSHGQFSTEFTELLCELSCVCFHGVYPSGSECHSLYTVPSTTWNVTRRFISHPDKLLIACRLSPFLPCPSVSSFCCLGVLYIRCFNPLLDGSTAVSPIKRISQGRKFKRNVFYLSDECIRK